MKRFVGLGAVLAAALGVAGCSSSSNGSTSTTPVSNGVASETASQILNSVDQAVTSATSIQVTGNIVQKGKQETFQVVTFSSGNFSGNFVQGGNTVMFVKIGSTDYLNASAGYYESSGASASVAGLIGGIWVSGPDSQLGFGNSFTISSIFRNFKHPTGTISKGSASTIDGQAAFSLKSSKGGVLWVATTGTAYPIELTKFGSSSGTVKFTAWNQGTPPLAPAGAKPISSFG
jgi:hypothetical protein